MVPHCCTLGAAALLLLGEITTSQLCKSLITMVDGFHTLFILMHVALPLPRTPSIIKPLFSLTDSPASSSCSPSSVGALPPLPASPLPGAERLDQPNLPAAPACGLSLPSSRIQPVGVFISALLLVSLCISFCLEIISHTLEPHPVQLPLLPVMVGAVSLLCKMLLFVLNWDRLQDGRTESSSWTDTGSHFQINHRVSGGEDSPDQEERAVRLNVPSAAHGSLHSGALVLCNPGTSSVSDTDCKTQQQQPEFLHDAERTAADLKSESAAENQNNPDDQNTSKASSLPTETPVWSGCGPICSLSSVFALQGLFTSFLALFNSLVMLFIAPQLLHSSAACSILVYLDPGLSLLAVITLMSAAAPQVYRYGLLLLQASPPHISVSELRQRIASVPGVQDVHDFHVWQLTESLTVASVHVHCCAGVPVHRCASLISGITKVLQNVGVSCCTVQPEFTCSSRAGDPTSPSCRDEPCSAPLPACSLACGRPCAASMCCSLLEDGTWSVLRPKAAETKEDPQTLVIENTFH